MRSGAVMFLFSRLLPFALSTGSAFAIDVSPLHKIEPGDSPAVILEKAAHTIPTARQLAYHRQEFIGFIHFGPNTFSGREWGNGMEDPASFAPTQVDTDDWCKHMKAAGITMVVMTFKHHDGYVLWQSRYEAHQTIKNSPWKQGKGDIAKDLSASCAKHGLKFGVYISPADLYQIESKEGLYGNGSAYVESVIPTDPAAFKTEPIRERKDRPQGAPVFRMKCDDYNRYMLNQLYELLTEYGPVHEVWFDGATPKSKGGQKYTYNDWYAIIRKLAPDAMIFGKGPDTRWCGNEAGGTRDTEWNVIPLAVAPEHSDWPDLTDNDLGSRDKLRSAKYLYYLPCETNTSIRHGWFWRNDHEQSVRSADDVFDIYERSVGGNSVFMLNVPPNQDGRFSQRDVDSLHETGRRIRATYGTDLAEGASISVSAPLSDDNLDTFWEAAEAKGEIIIDLSKATTLNRFVFQEALAKRGQRIEKHALDAWVNGSWQEIANGTTVGYKKILRFHTVTTEKLRLRILESRLTPTVAEISAHFYAQPPLPVAIRVDRKGEVSLALDQPRFTGKGAGFQIADREMEIRYTLDGSEPTRNSVRYVKPIALPDGGTVKARSFSATSEGAVSSHEVGIAMENWKAVASSEQNATYAADKSIDGNPETYWHSKWDAGHPTHPIELTIDLGETHSLRGITYLPRQDRPVPDSMIEEGRVETSMDGQSWKSAGTFTFGNLVNDPSLRSYHFSAPVESRFLRIVSLKGAAGKPYAGAAEIGALAK